MSAMELIPIDQASLEAVLGFILANSAPASKAWEA
jgi:hypothetical protein